DASDFAANQKGWALAVAIDGRAQPTQFNSLVGSAQVNEQTTGLTTGYNALAIAKNSAGAAARNSDGTTTDLIFDDTNYDRLAASGGAWTGGLNGGANLQILTLADTYLLRTPGNNPNNRPPIAEFEPIEAFIEARHATGANVRLDGRVSSDPDGPDDPLSFK